MPDPAAIDAFIARCENSGAAERANYQLSSPNSVTCSPPNPWSAGVGQGKGETQDDKTPFVARWAGRQEEKKSTLDEKEQAQVLDCGGKRERLPDIAQWATAGDTALGTEPPPPSSPTHISPALKAPLMYRVPLDVPSPLHP